MMTDGLTPEQRAAIETLDADVCVSAGAGSGKTRVLVERFLRLAIGETGDGRRETGVGASGGGDSPAGEVARPEPRVASPVFRLPSPVCVDQILAITFTRKAALEMKERIAHSLTALGCIEERRRLEVGYISTIHTFCERVLRENPFEAGLDPEFTVLDDAQAALLRDQAFEQVLEAAFARADDPVAELAQCCYDRRTREGDGIDNLRKNTSALLESLSSLGWGPAEVAAWAAEPLEQFLERSLALLTEQLEPVLGIFRAGIRVLCGLSLGSGQMEANRQELVAALPSLRTPDPSASPDEASAGGGDPAPGAGPDRLNTGGRSAATMARIEKQLSLLAGLRKLLIGRQTKEMAPQSYAIAREQFEAMKAAYGSHERWAQSWTRERERQAQARARAGVELLARLWSRYEALKQERAALDFSDLQRRARDLLRDSPPVRARLRARLRYLMIDEFQDTDRLQAEILDLLRGEGNLFFVGDVKQSIYRFRHADVSLFIERERSLRELEARDPAAARRLALTVNFRSRPEILAFVNGLFERLWANHVEGMGAAGFAYEPLSAGRAFAEKLLPAIELLPIRVEGSAEDVRRAEARQIARRVRALLDEGAVITRCDHPRCGQPLRPRDVVVLLYTPAVAQFYEQTLEEAGLPTFVDGGRDYYARREIRDVVNLLKTISAPLDDLAVAAALRSPFVGISLDTLTLLSIQARSQPDEPRCLYSAILPALEAQPIEPEDGERLRAFTALIDRLRALEDRLPVGHLLEIALAETDYVLEVLRRRGGRRTVANLRKLQQLANTRAAGGVAPFIEQIEELTRVSEREGDAPTHAESADVVRLMSIHKAKGLEFPVVVLPDLGRRPRPPERPLLALDPDRRRAAFSLADEGGHLPPLQCALSAAEMAADREESLRLLYVALTRAEEHLILAGPQPGAAGTWAHLLWQHVPLSPTLAGSAVVELFDGVTRATVSPGG